MAKIDLDEAALLASVSRRTLEREIAVHSIPTSRGAYRKTMVDVVDVIRLFPRAAGQMPPTVGSTRVIAIVNHKGGVGKTTTAGNVGTCLAQRQYRVLLVDCDPQANLTQSFGLEPAKCAVTLYHVLVDKTHPAKAFVRPYAALPTLYLLPANIKMGEIDTIAERWVSPAMRLRGALKSILDQFDFVLLDCPPSLGKLLRNAITAATELIVPLDMGPYALYGLNSLTDLRDEIVAEVNPNLGVTRALLNAIDPRTNVSMDIRAAIDNAFGPYVFKTVIRHSVKIPEAQFRSLPLTLYSGISETAEQYHALTEEIVAATEEAHSEQAA